MNLMPLLIPSGKLAIRDVIPCLVLYLLQGIYSILVTSQFKYLLPFTLYTLWEKRGKPIADTDSNPFKWEKI